jgi:hypothetical protein
MPTWIHPVLRTIQEDLEAEGLVKPVNTPLYNNLFNQEQAGVLIKTVIFVKRFINGKIYSH